jgi:hypothetical protein
MVKIVVVDRFHKQEDVAYDAKKGKVSRAKQCYRVDKCEFNGFQVMSQDVWAMPHVNSDHPQDSRRYLAVLDEPILVSKDGPTALKAGDMVVINVGGEYLSDYIYLPQMNLAKTREANSGSWPNEKDFK